MPGAKQQNKQELAIAALLTHATIQEAARTCGVV